MVCMFVTSPQIECKVPDHWDFCLFSVQGSSRDLAGASLANARLDDSWWPKRECRNHGVHCSRTQDGGSEGVFLHDLHLCARGGGEKFDQIFSPPPVSFISNLTEYDGESCNFQQIHQRYKPSETGLHWDLGSGQRPHFQCQRLCEQHGYNTQLHPQLYNTGLWRAKSLDDISQPWVALCKACLLPLQTTPSPAKPFMNPSISVSEWQTAWWQRESWLYQHLGVRVWIRTCHARALVCKLMKTLSSLPHLCFRELLPEKLELPYFVNCNIPSVKNQSHYFMCHNERKKDKKVWSNAFLSLKILFWAYMKF